MPKRTILVLLFSIVAVALSAADRSSTTVRVFNLKNASVIEAFTAIEPLLSNDGSVTVQPSRGRITIQDSPEVVGRIASMMAELDRIPGEYRIEVELLEGLDVERAPELAPELD